MESGELMRNFVQHLMMVQTSFRQSIQRSMKLNQIDLTFEMLQIILYLERRNGVNQQELADKTFKDKASLTSLLKNMEKKKLVLRAEDTSDRRNKKVFLSPKGREYGDCMRPLLKDIYVTVGKNADKEQIELSIHYLEELNNVFKNLE